MQCVNYTITTCILQNFMTKNVFWTKHETQKQQKQQQNKQANTHV